MFTLPVSQASPSRKKLSSFLNVPGMNLLQRFQSQQGTDGEGEMLLLQNLLTCVGQVRMGGNMRVNRLTLLLLCQMMTAQTGFNCQQRVLTTEVAESTVSGGVDSSHVRTNLIPGYEHAQMSGSSSMLPIAPMLDGSDTRQKGPIPFVTMLPFPVYNFPNEIGNSSLSTSQFGIK